MRSRHIRTLAATGSAAALVAAALVAGSSEAYADEPHAPVLIHATSAHSPAAEKEVTVRCPGATLVYAAGGGVGGAAGGTGRVAVTGVVPNAELTAVTVRAAARAGHAGAWSVVGQAICEASGARMYRAADSTTAPAGAVATCDDGTKVFGTGFSVAGDPDHGYVTDVVPDEGLTQVRVRAAGGAPGAVTAYAVCREQTGAMRRVAAVGPAGAGWPRDLTVADTAEAHIYGVGGRAGGHPQAFLDAMVLRAGGAGGGVRAVLAGPDQAPQSSSGVARSGGAGRADDGEESTAYGVLLGSFHVAP